MKLNRAALFILFLLCFLAAGSAALPARAATLVEQSNASASGFSIDRGANGGELLIGQTFFARAPFTIQSIQVFLRTGFAHCRAVQMILYDVGASDPTDASDPTTFIHLATSTTVLDLGEAFFSATATFFFENVPLAPDRWYFWGITVPGDADCTGVGLKGSGSASDIVQGHAVLVDFRIPPRVLADPNVADYYEFVNGFFFPPPEELVQFRPGEEVGIVEGDTITQNTIAFRARLTSRDSDPVKLQVELRTIGESFTSLFDGGILESDFVPSGSTATLSRAGLSDAPYHWRARAVDSQGNASEWREFGKAGNIDIFVVTSPLPSGVLYEQPVHASVPYSDFGGLSPVMAETFFMRTGGRLTSITLRVNYALCRRPVQAKIYTVAPNNALGIPDTLVATSINAPDNNDLGAESFSAFHPITWRFNNPVILERGRTYALLLEWLDPGIRCFANFTASADRDGFVQDNLTSSKLYSQSQIDGRWIFISESDLTMTVRGETAREPVIIVPGIMGTRLNRVSDGEEVWPNIMKLVESPRDEFLSQLGLSSSGTQFAVQEIAPSEVIGVATGTVLGVIPVERVIYKNLFDVFIVNGYVPGVDLYEFPYDWRVDLSDQISRLDEVVDQTASSSPNGRVNIVVHSMGGLLVKKYLGTRPDTSFLNKLVIVGSPQLGSPEVFQVLNYGSNLGFTLGSFDILYAPRIKEISQNMPGIYELLSSRRYITINGGYVEDFRSTGPKAALDYEQTRQFMLKDPGDSRNELLLTRADQFHGDLDGNPINASNVYNIVGCQNANTIGKFRIYDGGKIDITTIDGDGTVPLTSAMNLANGYRQNYFVRYDLTNIDHQGLVRDNSIVALIADILGDRVSNLPHGVSTSTSHCFTTPSDFINETTISVSTHSPVALHVYNSQNRHTGPLPNGDIELGIPNSSYERIGGNSFAFVPAGDQYRFVADGLAAGEFDMKVKTYRGIEPANTVTYLSVPLQGEQTNAELGFSGSQTPQDLKLDSDGNGVFETAVPPTAILDASLSADILPPEISIVSPTSTAYERSQIVAVIVNATDTDSGVAFTETRLDGMATTSTALDLFFFSLGDHGFFAHAVDNAGNPANTSTSFSVVATLESTISDTERANALGWITKKSVKNEIINKLKKAVRIEKKIEIIKEKQPDGTEVEHKVEHLERKVDKILLKLLLEDLGKWRQRGIINDVGYQLLAEDINWLLSN